MNDFYAVLDKNDDTLFVEMVIIFTKNMLN